MNTRKRKRNYFEWISSNVDKGNKISGKLEIFYYTP